MTRLFKVCIGMFYILGLLALAQVCDAATDAYTFNILSVHRAAGAIRVVTTGAEFRISGNQVRCLQTINLRRCVAVVKLPCQANETWIPQPRQGSYTCSFVSRSGISLVITGDSVLRVSGASSLVVSSSPRFDAQFRERAEASAIFADEQGGAGVYGPKGARMTISGQDSGAWRVDYPQLKSDPYLTSSDVLISVFPPRPFNWRQAAQNRLVHYFPSWIPGTTCQSDQPYPTDAELVEWRKIGNVLVLHAEAWSSFGSVNIQPADPVRFKEVLQKAHELGWKVLIYTSPFYYHGNLKSFEAEMAHIMSYGVDGMYWDYTVIGVEQAWQIAKAARRLLGDRLLYIHLTQTPFMNKRMIVPFVDTYADFVLRGENMSWAEIDPAYLRYAVSSYNMGNSIGTLCYDTCRISPEIVRAVLGVNARLTYWVGSQHNTDNGKDYFLTPAESQVYIHDYMPQAEKLTATKLKPMKSEIQAYYATRSKMRLKLRNDLATAAVRAGKMQNLAAFKPVAASDISGNGAGAHGLGPVPEYVTDGQTNTYWAADLGPQWVEVDLQKAQPINRIVVRNYFSGEGRYYRYRIVVSRDHVNWRQLAFTNGTTPATAEGDAYNFGPDSARYVRVIMLSNSANPGLHVSELEVYGR
ncbi:MAG: discoidin domain-containing protein [Armatimonadota bacterium]